MAARKAKAWGSPVQRPPGNPSGTTAAKVKRKADKHRQVAKSQRGGYR